MVKVNDLSNTIATGEKSGLTAKINIIQETNAGLKQNIQLQETKNQALDETIAKRLTDDQNTDQQKKKTKTDDQVNENKSILERIKDILRLPTIARSGELASNQQSIETPQRKEERSAKKDLENKYGKLSKSEYNDMVDNRFTLKPPKSFG
jgi:hypothetical protein